MVSDQRSPAQWKRPSVERIGIGEPPAKYTGKHIVRMRDDDPNARGGDLAAFQMLINASDDVVERRTGKRPERERWKLLIAAPRKRPKQKTKSAVAQRRGNETPRPCVAESQAKQVITETA